MTRREGILKMASLPENKRVLSAAKGNLGHLLRTEYKNYKELCYYCSEKPKSFEEWTNEEIKESVE